MGEPVDGGAVPVLDKVPILDTENKSGRIMDRVPTLPTRVQCEPFTKKLLPYLLISLSEKDKSQETHRRPLTIHLFIIPCP